MAEPARPSEGLTLPCAARSVGGGAFAPTLAAAQARTAAVQPSSKLKGVTRRRVASAWAAASQAAATGSLPSARSTMTAPGRVRRRPGAQERIP